MESKCLKFPASHAELSLASIHDDEIGRHRAPSTLRAPYAWGDSGVRETGGGVPDGRLPQILRVSPDALSQLELMLESVFHSAAETHLATTELSRSLAAKQDLLDLQQSNYRNSLLNLSLQVSVIAVSISSATLVTSAFGQNLTSGLEGTAGAFALASAASAALGLAVYRAFRKYVEARSPMVQDKTLDTFANFLVNDLDRKVGEAEELLEAGARGGGKEGLRKALATAGRVVDEEELGLLWELAGGEARERGELQQ